MYLKCSALVLLFVAVIVSKEQVVPVSKNFTSHEKMLMSKLVGGLDPAVRPVRALKETVKVFFDFVLIELQGIDEKTETLECHGWIHEKWKDFQLAWDPKEYGGIDIIRIPAEKLWKPDIDLFNSASMETWIPKSTLAVVKADGTVIWFPRVHLRSKCTLNMHLFPFDTQTCYLIFGSWTYDASKIDLQLPNDKKLTGPRIVALRQFTLTDTKAERALFNVSKDEAYAELIYTLTMERKASYHSWLFVIPGVFMAILTAFMFWIPPGSGERVIVGVAVIITCTVLNLSLEVYLPEEILQMPAIGRLYSFTMALASIGVLLTITVLNCHHRDHRKEKVPHWIRKVFLRRLSPLVCMRAEAYSSVPTEVSNTETTLGALRVDAEMDSLDQPLPRSPTMAIEKTLDEIRRYLKMSVTRTSLTPSTSHRELVVNEWHQVALVVDRICFWLYVVVLLLGTIVIFKTP